jgi:patatin-related protein
MTDVSSERALYQELRLALTINGGVSLAVWMGAVVSEIDRFRCAFSRQAPGPAKPYAALLDALETLVVPDVIAGSSAGGMNGALLAYVIANGKSLDCAGPDKLRSTWQQLGSIDRLLPTNGEPSSILLGEEVLFRGCAEVFGALQAAPRDLDEDASRWVRLTVTATDSVGYDVTTQEVTTPDHRLRMQFRQVERPSGSQMHLGPQLVGAIHAAIGQPAAPNGTTEWPFPARPSPRDLARTDAAAYLARATRCTASFPIAFAPSEIPLNHTIAALPGSASGDALTATPPMADILEAANPTSELARPDDPQASRFVVDGGVWDNSPFSAVLRGIDRMPAGRDVRRVLAYVVGTRSAKPSRKPIVRPGLAASLINAVALPADLSFANDLERIADDRQRQSIRRESAPELLVDENLDPFALAHGLFPLYRKRRLRDELAITYAALARDVPTDPADVPWLPPSAKLPGPESSLADWWATSAGWSWGIVPVRASIQQARRLLRAVIRRLTVLRSDRAAQALLEALIDTRELLSQLTWVLDDLAHIVEQAQAAAPAHADLSTTGWNDATRGVCGQVMAEFAAATAALNAPLAEYLEALPPGSDLPTLVTAVRLTAGGPELIIKRALAIEIVLGALSKDGGGQGLDYSLVAIRPDDRWPLPADDNPLPGDHTQAPHPARPPLAGASHHHFGGFLRASWRVHDWMWGRLDGTRQLIELLLDERQLTRLCGSPPVAANVTSVALGMATAALPDDNDDIAGRVIDEAFRARGAAAPLGDATSERLAIWRRALATQFEADIARVLIAGQGSAAAQARDDALARLRADLARRFQLAILDEEIPILAAASEKDGGAPVDVAALLASRDKGLRALTTTPPGAAITAHEGHQLLEHGAANAAFGLGHPHIGHALRRVARASNGWWSIRHAFGAPAGRRRKP